MKKRLRKKKRIGEFRQNGFEVRVLTKQSIPLEDPALTWRFVDEVVGHGLAAGGSLSGMFIVARGRRSVTEAQRTYLIDWLIRQPEVDFVAATYLIDAWYDDPKDEQWLEFRLSEAR